LFFTLNFVRLLGANQQQRTAIEAAALAAARDLSKIVVEDPNFGFISLSDAAPIHTATIAGDKYFLSVQGINTLTATVRLDMIIANQFNDPIMQQLAQRDYTNLIIATNTLSAAISNCIGGGGVDADGNMVVPLTDALNAYQQNSVRMMGVNKCTLVPGSMKISLGYILTEPTSTPIPQPATYSQLSANQQNQGFYMPYVDVPYGGKDFVFTATASSVHLVDQKNFLTSVSGLPYQIPVVVKCEANELYKRTDNLGNQSQDIVHSLACAVPACMLDNLPAPGSFQLSFPNGRPATITSLGSILTSVGINGSPADFVLTSPTDDSPPATCTPLTILPNAPKNPAIAAVIRVALYDWIRKARTKPNLQILANTFAQTLSDNQPMTSSHAIYFDFGAGGTINTRSAAIDPTVAGVVSQNQVFAASGLAVQNQIVVSGNTVNSPQAFDVFVKDYTYTVGRINGGKHAGEPLGGGTTIGGATPINPTGKWLTEGISQVMQFPTGPGQGAVRPTYQTPGTALEISFRQRSN
jgi:hypothetical protein